jgi:hypothetical protein
MIHSSFFKGSPGEQQARKPNVRRTQKLHLNQRDLYRLSHDLAAEWRREPESSGLYFE